MAKWRRRVPALFWLCPILSGIGAAQISLPALNYGRDVRPILSENCFPCHGQDVKKRMANLRLDTLEGATADRGGHAALTPGNLQASAIYQRISAEDRSRRMPPVSSNRNLTVDQIAVLKRWIEEGGKYSTHWAFVPATRPMVPAADPWIKGPVDAFVLQRLRAEGLKPGREATPGTWLRRVSLDLTGLAATPPEIDAFAREVITRGEAAYVAAVDRLLASPAYGERMAMDWMDVARYADTHGFNNDAERSMWRWRDWVIDAFNANMPYSQFLTEQLAGDLLPNPTLNQRIATGFGRNHVINSEGGIIEEEYRVEYVSDRVRTLGMAWLGLTLECAHCHDHKFDPITQRDHYRFFAFFNNMAELGEDGRVANAVPMIPAPTVEQQKRMRELEAAIASFPESPPTQPERSPNMPAGATLQIPCNECAPGAMEPKPETAVKVPVSKREPLTFSMWLKPLAADSDVALLSAIDYSKNMAAVGYGAGIEVHLAAGEIEFRLSQRFPNYSVRVRSDGGAIGPDRWRHVAVVYSGVGGNDLMRVQAAWVRMFIDGLEVPTVVLNDGVTLPDASADKPTQTTFRIGWDNAPGSPRYQGLLDKVSVWNRVLNAGEIAGWLGVPLPEREKLRGELLALRREAPTVMVMQEMTKPRETHILLRGQYDTPGDKVDAGVPEDLLGAWPAGAPRNRLGLAQWLTKPDHPLTSRVVVNRFWQQVFGLGLVKTSDNFGLQGEWTSHPELLDWLATEFVASAWNVKALMKTIVLSATYRQDSSASPELVARDPENRLLARGPRFRLPAEAIRDHALQIAGLLKQKVGGPSVFPYQPPDLYKGIVVAATYPGTKYVESTGGDLYRRSLYTYWKRTVPHPTMNVFDAPDREVCIVRRSTTNTPLQALTLLNDPIFVEAARKLAERVIHEGGVDPEARLTLMFRLATGRAPDDRELTILRQSLDEMLAAYQNDDTNAKALISVGASRSDASIPVGQLAAWTVVANIVLNMDETITKD